MANVISLSSDASNTVDGPGDNFQTQADKGLTNDGNFAILDTVQLSGLKGEEAIYSDWDSIASGLPSTSTVNGLQVIFPEILGNVSALNLFLSIDGGSSYSSGLLADISAMEFGKTASVTSSTSPSSETHLWGLTWNPGTLNWDNVWVKMSINGTSANKEFQFDYIQLKVYYSDVVIPKVLTINGSLTLNGQLIIK